VAQELLNLMLTATPDERRFVLSKLDPEQRLALKQVLKDHRDNPWARYVTDPVAFIEQGLGETLWSKQREILYSLRDNKRTAVPACHAPGKSFIAARAVAWWVSSHPAGTAQVVTTATTFRQVRNILWNEVRKVATKHNLPGEVLSVEWQLAGGIVAYGLSSGANNEASIQGIHAPHLLVVVDEAGGIPTTTGQALEALMTGDHTRLLAIGNPSTEADSTWFERICHSDLYNVIKIAAYDTPAFTGEETGWCHSCPPIAPAHKVASHLVDKTWVEDVLSEYGAESPFAEARIHARFPKTFANRVIPLTWAEESVNNENPASSPFVRLGVDIASDGGDEMVVARADGFRVSIVHKSSGAENQNAVDVARTIMAEIKKAEAIHANRQLSQPVVVKIDAIGVGWGVTSLLQTWFNEGKHKSTIVPVKVGERALDAGKFTNQRAEMWWTGRELLEPVTDSLGNTIQQVRLEVDNKTIAQLGSPAYKSDSSGRIAIEKKTEMKNRGIGSPDRAEAVLLALYEPKKNVNISMPVSFTQENPWRL
jgi:hypothetical protein